MYGSQARGDATKYSDIDLLVVLPSINEERLHRAFESRLEGDYQDYSKLDRKKATEILQSDDEFVKSIEAKLSSRS
jgi:predicted nucleotidyltransferase